MTFEGLGEMFEGDSADMWARKFLLMLMGGLAEGLACADLGARTPIGGNIPPFLVHQSRYHLATRSKADYNFNLDKWSQVQPQSKHQNVFTLYFPAVLKYLIYIWSGMNGKTYPYPGLNE